MEFKNLILEIDKRGVATLTLNKPQRHNAFDDVMITELFDAFHLLSTHKSVRAVLLKGAGKSFSAGADLDWMKRAAGYSKSENEADANRLSDMLNALRTLPCPVIALVHGAVMGGATGLVSCADVTFATKDAFFAISEVRLGLIPATISPYVIAAIGERQARRYMLTGERFDADTAKAIGLVHEVVASAAVMTSVVNKFIEVLLQTGPEAVAATKQLIMDVTGRPVTDKLRADTAARIAKVRAGDEAREGLAAFLEKRKPSWRASDG